ncbi:winged helix-turn-helix domain-containing protein [Arthrobacter ulcerisalmonis]|uniref:winged helix-turn-helix domain-containing protein n=1 Tax=Arthrobacter ulcerisalmonis TaxID=2483813 RepID=UPI000F52DFD5|nr:winged helix-turn-helix domain-containing protein [Arthrobacter ulcerisalmonis]
MAVQVHHPRPAGARHVFPAKGAAARGLAVWVVPAEGTPPDVLRRAAELVLARALKTAPQAEVHWLAASAPSTECSAPTEDHAANSSPRSSAAERFHSAPGLATASRGAEGVAGDGGTHLPPSAGPVSRVSVDLAADQVLLDGCIVPLTGVEFKVLRYLVTHLSRTVSREELQGFLDTFETPGASTRSIDVYVGRIRRKLGTARHAVATVRGGGYQFVPGQAATVRGPAEYCI